LSARGLSAIVRHSDGARQLRVEIVASITSATGAVVFKNGETRDSSALQGQQGAYGYLTKVALADLPAGPYVLKVEAQSNLGDHSTASRQVPFTIASTAP
jgi:hypothetical protein